jgi:hypothetical protein
VYKKQMDLISDKLSKAGKDKQTFILFSNEALNIHASETVLLSHEKWYVDHHCMSLCNYLIGPPSTFTLWASYLGKTELKYIQNKDENIADKLNINLLTSQ